MLSMLAFLNNFEYKRFEKVVIKRQLIIPEICNMCIKKMKKTYSIRIIRLLVYAFKYKDASFIV